MTHFFITVGTSQLENEYLRKKELTADQLETIDDLIRGVSRNEARDSDSANRMLQEKLVKGWQYPAQTGYLFDINEGNPFGAEITTLWALLHKQGKPFAVQGEDYFFLLTSGTMPGRLAGQVLCDFLMNTWNVPNQRVRNNYEISSLKDNPRTEDDAKEALFNFAKTLSTALEHSAQIASLHKPARQFIMSGGFKSLIPVLDWFSLAYQISLNYLFEKSEHPVRDLLLEPLEINVRGSIRDLIQNKYPGIQLPPLDRF